MEEKSLNYSVSKNEFVKYWLTSEVKEVSFEASPVPDVFENYHPGASVKGPDGKERLSPAKREFLKRGEFRKSGYPAGIKMDRLYFPFDTQRVDFSGAWDFPTDIRFYARTWAVCNEECTWRAELFTCGALKIWVNGKEQAAFYPYEANLEKHCEAILSLKAGKNEIVVGCNNYGERNIIFNFGLRNLSAERMDFSLPVSADADALREAQKVVSSMYPERLSYDSGTITFCTRYAFQRDTQVKVKTESRMKNLLMHAGSCELVWGDAQELTAGYYEFTVSVDVEGVTLRTTLGAEIFPKRNIRMADTESSIEDRKSWTIDHIIAHTPKTFERYLACLARGKNPAGEYRDCWTEYAEFVNRRGDCADFRAVKLLWAMIRFGDLLTEEQRNLFRETILSFRYWYDEPGNDAMWFFSENHALCFHTAQFLAGELYPEEIFENSGYNGTQQVRRAKYLITEWMEKFLEHGYNEWNSPCYIPVDMLAYLSLRELAEDKEVKQLADKALDYTCEILAENSFHGFLAGACGRIYTKEILADRNMGTNSPMWILWGEGCLNAHQSPALFLALSDYRPPEGLKTIACWNKKLPYIKERRQGNLQVPTMILKTADYSMASCLTPRTGGPGSQELLMNVFLEDGRLRVWINHPGERKIFGIRRPGYFNGNGLTPLVSQRKNVAVLSYGFREKLLPVVEADFTKAFCDLSLCDEAVVRENWAFVRKGEAYLAIYAQNGLQVSQNPPLREKELISPGIRNNWLIKVSNEREAVSFEKFTVWHLEHTPEVENGMLVFLDRTFGRMEFVLMKETSSNEWI